MKTVKEVAAEFGCSYRKILRLIDAGEFPGAVKVGAGRTMPWLIPAQDVEDYKKRTK